MWQCRYYGNSTTTRRNIRAKNYANIIHYLLNTPLPFQRAIRTVISNKMQLIKLNCTNPKSHADTIPQNGNTGLEPTPVQIYDSYVTQRHDVRTTPKEAGMVIIQKVVYLSSTNASNITVVSENVDVSALFLHCYIT